MRETLISLLDDVQYQGNSVRTSTNYIQNDEIADYLLTNNVVVTSYRPGDTVHVISSYYTGVPTIYECDITSIMMYEYNTFIRAQHKHNLNITFRLNSDRFNKEFFLTYEDAKAALRRLRRTMK